MVAYITKLLISLPIDLHEDTVYLSKYNVCILKSSYFHSLQVIVTNGAPLVNTSFIYF